MTTLVLDDVLKTIKASLDAAPSVNPDFTASYADNDGSTFVEKASDGALNGTSDVTIVAAPPTGFRRIIKKITIENKNSSTVVLTVKYDNNGTQRTIAKVTLNPQDTWSLEGTFDQFGSLKQTLGTVNVSSVTGTLPIANGGTGQTTQQAALNALAASVTNGEYLRGNGSNVAMSALQAGDITGTVDVDNGGTGQTSYTDGQLLIGNTAGGLSKATLTAGTNVTITNGNGTITIDAAGGSGITTGKSIAMAMIFGF